MTQPFKFRYANEIAGAFVILALVLFAVGVFFAGSAQGWFEGKFELVGTFETERGSFGLREGAEVWVMDTVAGRIAKIEPTGEGRMQARLLIQNRFLPFIRRDAVARVKRKFGVAGDAYVDIEMGNGRPIHDGASIPCRRDEELVDTARTMLEELKKDVLPMLEDVKTTLASVDTIAAGLAAGDGVAGAALRDNAMRDEVVAMLGQVNELMETSDLAIRETTKLIRGAQKHWLLRKYIASDEGRIVLSAAEVDAWSAGSRAEWERSLAEARLANSSGRTAHYSLSLGYAALAEGDLERAQEWANEARAELEAAGRDGARAALLEAEVARRAGRLLEAGSILGTPGETPRDTSREFRAAWLLQQGRLALQQDQPRAAAELLRDVSRLLRRSEAPALDAAAADLGGDLALQQGDPAMAADYFDLAANRLREGHMFHGMTVELMRAGDAYADAAFFDLAADRYYRAARCFWAADQAEDAEDILASARAAADDAGRRDLLARIEALQGEISAL